MSWHAILGLGVNSICSAQIIMMVNGLVLPGSLVHALESGRLRREVGSWQLKKNLDSFGNGLETELGELFGTLAQIRDQTDALPRMFPVDQVQHTWPRDFIGPGAIPDFSDFSRIICFAIAGGGEPFCLDYREQSDQPSVIWWDDSYWRKVSPNFDSFLELFDLRAVEGDVS